jgi:hypothetical protein
MSRVPIILICAVLAEAFRFAQSVIQAANVHALVGLFGGLTALLHVIALYYVWQVISSCGSQYEQQEQQDHEQ